jgi:hypothetical protein
MAGSVKFNWEDPFLLDDQLDEDERAGCAMPPPPIARTSCKRAC